MSATRAGKGRPRSAARGKTKPAQPAAPARKPRTGRPAKPRSAGVSLWRRLAWPAVLALALIAVAAAWLLPAQSPAPVPPKAAQPPPAAPVAKPPAPPAAAPTPYEEPLNGADISRRLVAVDEAIFSALAKAGIASADIRLRVEPQAGVELTRLDARLAAGQDAAAVARAVALSLRGKADLVREESQGRAGETILVHLGPHLTHLLRLTPAGVAPAPPQPSPPAPPPGRPRAAIVIDDLGHSLEAARKLLDLDLPLAFSVLPFSAHGREVAEEARARGHEVLLHLPMEPKSYPQLSPGPGALLAAMSPERLRLATQAALAAVPGAAGVNNHMGSRLTEDQTAMQAVCEVLRERGLFFLDSLTSPRSQAWSQARRMGVAFARRDIFLDHDPGVAAVAAQLARLIELAKARGQAVAIGHPHAATIQALAEQAGRLRQEVELTTISRLLSQPAAQGLDKPAPNP